MRASGVCGLPALISAPPLFLPGWGMGCTHNLPLCAHLGNMSHAYNYIIACICHVSDRQIGKLYLHKQMTPCLIPQATLMSSPRGGPYLCMNWTRSVHVALQWRGTHLDKAENSCTQWHTCALCDGSSYSDTIPYTAMPCLIGRHCLSPAYHVGQVKHPQHILSSCSDTPICGDALLLRVHWYWQSTCAHSLLCYKCKLCRDTNGARIYIYIYRMNFRKSSKRPPSSS